MAGVAVALIRLEPYILGQNSAWTVVCHSELRVDRITLRRIDVDGALSRNSAAS